MCCCLCGTLLDFLRLTLTLGALVCSVLTLFLPLFTSEFTDQNTATTTDAPNGKDDDSAAAGKTIHKADITLWKMHSSWVNDHNILNETSVELVDYFHCNTGRRNIQVVEGISIVLCVLTCLNIIMCITSFFVRRIFRIPLLLYFLLSLAAAVTVFTLLLVWYKDGWCESQPALGLAEDMHWKYAIGWVVIPVSAGLSLVGFIFSLISQ